MADQDYYYLCCACGKIRPANQFVSMVLDDDTEKWVEREVDSDPKLRCPECRHIHIDDSGNPGLPDGTLLEMTRERKRMLATDNAPWVDDDGC